MLWKLGLLFTIVPLLETYVLIRVGGVIGPLPTVLILLIDGILGAWLAKREGLGIVRSVADDLQRGLPPATRLVEGVLIIIGAVLLVTPGLLTDVVGILLLIPFTRQLLAPYVLRWGLARFKIEGIHIGAPAGAGAPAEEAYRTPEAERRNTPFDHPVR